MSIKPPQIRSIWQNGLFGYFIKLFFRRDRKDKRCGPTKGVEGTVLVSECMDNITSHLASCHVSKCSKVFEIELILREQVCEACKSWNDNLPKAQTPAGQVLASAKVLSITRSYWQNNETGRKTCRESPDGQRGSWYSALSRKYHSFPFSFFTQNLSLNVQRSIF